MRVLITGGAGFIGSHWRKLALSAGDEVYIIERPVHRVHGQHPSFAGESDLQE